MGPFKCYVTPGGGGCVTQRYVALHLKVIRNGAAIITVVYHSKNDIYYQLSDRGVTCALA